MKNFILYRISKIIIFGLLFFIINDPVYAVTNRAYEPIVISGNLLPDLYNADLTHLVVYNYNATLKTWTRISSQIDECGSDGKYLFGTPENLLTANDELLFLAKDCGDKAPSNLWLDETSTQNYNRYEIKITDPLYSNTGYVYVFRTDNPGLHPDTEDYVDFELVTSGANAGADYIYGKFYTVAHDKNHGIMTTLAITNDGGGDDYDFFDRWKLRIRGQVEYGSIKFDVFVTEDSNLEKLTPTAIDGKIRILRNWKANFIYKISGQTLRQPFEYVMKYYPNSCDFGAGSLLSKTSSINIDYLRLSFDLNSHAYGMKMFTANALAVKPNGTTINHLNENDDKGIPRDLNTPGWNWWMQTGTPGTLLNISQLPQIATYQQLYYLDNDGSTNEPIGVDHIDTGEDGSWGDTGVKYTGTIDLGAGEDPGNLQMKLYFLGANVTPDSAEVIRQFNANPVTFETFSQEYDIVPPFTITDLRITTVTDNSVSLTWTVPGDDGSSGGTANLYLLRYSTEQPGSDIWGWWSSAVNLTNLPLPGTPGSEQGYTVTNLDPNQNYYFCIRTGDEVPNWSDLSNVAFTLTTPVELASFTTTQQDRFVNIYWSTESETNNLGFAVERKFANKDSWTEITFVKGSGTTTLKRSYSYQDEPQFVGKTSYRLKQIDTDGTFTYSPEISLNINAPARFALQQNYPNPFNPNTVIEFEIPGKVTGQMELTIYDLLGRKVRGLIDKPVQAGYYKLMWDGKDDFGREVVTGGYFYMLKVGDLKQIRKMIKLK